MNETVKLLIDFMWNVFNCLSGLFFAFISIVLALYYENLGSPRLLFTQEPPSDGPRESGLYARFLHIGVKNSPRKAPFVTRQTAYSVHGTISFITQNGEQIGGALPIRWDGAPEPIKYEVSNGNIIQLPETSLIRVSRFMDIPPDEKETFSFAVRILNEKSAYGWNSESYFKESWHYEEYELPLGTYIAKIQLKTGGMIFEKEFQINNFDAFESFTLVEK
jgi:hypothetical protein